MNTSNYIFEPHTDEIPAVFRSHTDHSCIDHCIMCDAYLLEDGKNYLIEKAIRQYPGYKTSDCIFEYAICLDCAHKMQENISKDSLEKMNNFFESHVNFEERSLDLYNKGDFDPGNWTGNCVINGSSVHENEEYQLYGHFSGDKMIYSVFPYMISHKAIESLTALLSKSTKDEMDRFVNENFGLPPEYKELLKDRPLILV